MRTGRVATVIVLVVALLVASLTREWAMALQDIAQREGPFGGGAPTARGSASLNSLDSFALALLLGGLRGPLVMFLWISSESQKNERDLEDFDTKIELIRLLQPEFDTVHIFQIWNKAYNISAQLASLPNKYSTILDALDYARNVDRQRPNDINILLAINGVYSSKLGGSVGDKVYYIRRVREETRFRPDAGRSARAGNTSRRLHDPLLDASGMLLPSQTLVTRPKPADLPAKIYISAARLPEFRAAAAKAGVNIDSGKMEISPKTGDAVATLDESSARKIAALIDDEDVRFQYAEWNDGSELQYLRPYEPFPYGVSPIALGYDYAKRAQVLMTVGKQKPVQLSESVVDSRPGLELKGWAEEEAQRGTELELKAFEKPVPHERPDMEIPTQDVKITDAISDRSPVAEALFSYSLTARLCRDAKQEYRRHLSSPEEFINRFQNYGSHLDTLTAMQYMAMGDHDFLEAMIAPPGEQCDRAAASAQKAYQEAIAAYQYLDMQYYVPDELLPALRQAGFDRAALDKLRRENPRELDRLHTRMLDLIHRANIRDPNEDDRNEYLKYMTRAKHRLASLGGASQPAQQAAAKNPGG